MSGWIWKVELAFGVVSAAVGVALCFGHAAIPDFYLRGIAETFFGGEDLSAPTMALADWLLGTCGAGVLGWAIAWSWLAVGPLRRGEPWARRCLGVSLVAWVLADLAVALRFGMVPEAGFALVAGLLAGLPLCFGPQAAD